MAVKKKAPAKKTRRRPDPSRKPKVKIDPNNVGRPPLYKSGAELMAAIEDYFKTCDAGQTAEVVTPKGEVCVIARRIPYTVPGLADHLGFCSRNALWEMGKKPDFSDALTRALGKIERQRAEQALRGDVNPKFAAFDLNVNFGWTEKKQLDLSGGVQTEMKDEDRKALKDMARALGRKVAKG